MVIAGRTFWPTVGAALCTRAVARRCGQKGNTSRGSESDCFSCRAGLPVRALRSAAGRRVHWTSAQVLTLRSFDVLVLYGGGTGSSVTFF